MTLKCPRCDVPLKKGKAFIPQWFYGIGRCFFSTKAESKLVEVDKCSDCGHSEIEDLPTHEEYEATRVLNEELREIEDRLEFQERVNEAIRRVSNNIRKGHSSSPYHLYNSKEELAVIEHFKKLGWTVTKKEGWDVFNIEPLKDA